MRLAVWRCLRGAPASASRTDSTQAPLPSRAGLSRGAGTGAAGDMSSMSAYLATVLRLSPSLLAISALGTPSASIARISFRVSWDTVISSILPGALFWKTAPGRRYAEGRPRPCGERPSCPDCSVFNDHGAQKAVTIRTTSSYDANTCNDA